MRKVLVTLSIIFALSLNINAQGDGFFTTGSYGYRDVDSDASIPMIPERNLLNDFDANAKDNTPLGGGLLLLAGLGLAYGIRKTNISIKQ